MSLILLCIADHCLKGHTERHMFPESLRPYDLRMSRQTAAAAVGY